MGKFIIFLVACFSVSAEASLWLAGFGSQFGKNMKTTSVSLSQSFEVKKTDFGFSKWGLNGSRTQSKSDPEDASSETFNSTFFSASIVAQYQGFDFSLNGNSSQTNEVFYKANDMGIGVGYTWKFTSSALLTEKDPTQENDHLRFTPRLRLAISTGSGDVEQEISVRIFNRTYYRTFSMEQKNSSLDINYSPLEWLNAGLGHKKYSYSRSTNDIQAAVNSRFINYYASDLTTTLAGLAENSSYLSFDFYFNLNWDLNLTYVQSTILVDQSKTQNNSFAIGYNFDSGFRLEGGAGSYKADSTNETFTVFDVSYLF